MDMFTLCAVAGFISLSVVGVGGNSTRFDCLGSHR